MGGLSPMHLAVVLIIALLVFGPKKLPEIGRGLGQAIREFKKASRDMMESFHEAAEERPRPVPFSDTYAGALASTELAQPLHPADEAVTIEASAPPAAVARPPAGEPSSSSGEPAAGERYPRSLSDTPAAVAASPSGEPAPGTGSVPAPPGHETAPAPERTT